MDWMGEPEKCKVWVDGWFEESKRETVTTAHGEVHNSSETTEQEHESLPTK